MFGFLYERQERGEEIPQVSWCLGGRGYKLSWLGNREVY